jgi:hypothetical protein
MNMHCQITLENASSAGVLLLVLVHHGIDYFFTNANTRKDPCCCDERKTPNRDFIRTGFGSSYPNLKTKTR